MSEDCLDKVINVTTNPYHSGKEGVVIIKVYDTGRIDYSCNKGKSGPYSRSCKAELEGIYGCYA